MFNLPQSTVVNRKIPKNKFYEKLQANHHIKEIFTKQVESIIWKHKLSKETIHFESDWQPAGELQFEILHGLDLKAVYENIIRNLLSVKAKADIELTVVLERQVQMEKLTHECQRLEARICTEKQFNRKIRLNMELQRKRKELDQLLGK